MLFDRHAPQAAPSQAEALAQRHTLRIAVVVATVGRAATAARTIDRLRRQTRPPDRVLAVGVSPDDVAGLANVSLPVEVHFASRGLCCQRNRALAVLGGDADVVVFFDDDFLPADTFLARVEALFNDHPDIVGATGHVIADGANGPGIAFEDAEDLLAAHARSGAADPRTIPRRALYGCNMVIRASAIGELRFDEALPLYGWQEDIDFSCRLGLAGGRLVKVLALAGVHMGEKASRQSGLRLGYSQIANPVYLLGKRSIPSGLAFRVMRNNLASNLRRSFRPEPYIDRRGRLKGNMKALLDLVRGRMDPRRILDFK